MVFNIEASDSLSDIEIQIQRLWRLTADEIIDKLDLALPAKISVHVPGTSVAIIQLCSTWIRFKERGKLIINVKDVSELTEDVFMETEYLFPVIMLSWLSTPITERTGQVDIKQSLRDTIARIRSKMVRAEAMKGWKILLTSIDHFPPDKGMIPAYETISTFINNEKTLAGNFGPAFQQMLSYSTDSYDRFRYLEKDFVAIIKELLKNTYEWARTDANNSKLTPNIRGIFIKFHKKKRVTFQEEYRRELGLRAYFENQALQENSTNELYILEISVYDSGVGFVDKYYSPDKNSLNEIDIIKRCLTLHTTSSRSIEKDEKGIGLDRTLEILSKKGFFKIRTGSSSLYRNLITHPHKPGVKDSDIDLYDWESQSNIDFKKHAKVSGASITILYPLVITLT
jgi:hypothetical protein